MQGAHFSWDSSFLVSRERLGDSSWSLFFLLSFRGGETLFFLPTSIYILPVSWASSDFLFFNPVVSGVAGFLCFAVNASWPWCFFAGYSNEFFNSGGFSLFFFFGFCDWAISFFFFRGKFIFRGDCAQRSLVYEYDYEYRHGLLFPLLYLRFFPFLKSVDGRSVPWVAVPYTDPSGDTTQSLLVMDLCIWCWKRMPNDLWRCVAMSDTVRGLSPISDLIWSDLIQYDDMTVEKRAPTLCLLLYWNKHRGVVRVRWSVN